MSFLYSGTQTTPSTGGEAAQSRGDSTFLHLPAVLGLVHPRVWLVLWAARACCWLMFNLLPATAPRSLLRAPLSPHSPEFTLAQELPGGRHPQAAAQCVCVGMSSSVSDSIFFLFSQMLEPLELPCLPCYSFCNW